jgi:crotonobetaine/carnitine-CoA ligase
LDIIGRQTIISLLDEQLQHSENHNFITHESESGEVKSITYGEMAVFSEKIAAGLYELGVRKSSKVCIHLPNQIEFPACWVAISSLRAIMVPSNIWNTMREMEYVIEKADIEYVITDESFLPLFEQLAQKYNQIKAVIVVNGSIEISKFIPFIRILGNSRDLHTEGTKTEDLAQMMFTSGTTTHPKAVMHTQGNFVWCAIEQAKHYQFSPKDRNLSSLPLFHANCQSVFFGSLAGGSSILLLEKYSASRYMEQVRRHGATTISVVPMILRTLLAQPETDEDRNHQIRFVKYSINVSDEEMDNFVMRFGVNIMNGYGMSEAMVTITGTPLYGNRKWPSNGRPLIGREVKIVDKERISLPSGQIGEIAVKGVPGKSIFAGYYKDTESTQASLRENWFYTEDLGYFDEGGYLYYVGRKKEMIKRAGENVSTIEVEMVLSGHPSVQEVAVIGVTDPLRDQALKAFVVLKQGTEQVTKEDLVAFCNERLAKFKIPSFIEFISSLPKTSIGKIEKKVLYRLEADRQKQINGMKGG